MHIEQNLKPAYVLRCGHTYNTEATHFYGVLLFCQNETSCTFPPSVKSQGVKLQNLDTIDQGRGPTINVVYFSSLWAQNWTTIKIDIETNM